MKVNIQPINTLFDRKCRYRCKLIVTFVFVYFYNYKLACFQKYIYLCIA